MPGSGLLLIFAIFATMIMLQTNPLIPSEEITSRVDSAKIAASDFAEALASNPSEALHQLGTASIQFGLKVLLAIVIYIIGIWIIRLVKRALAKWFVSRRTDRTVASFVSSFTSVLLTIFLIVLTISTLGVNTTSLAALLAGGGVALGMALSGTLQNFSGGLLILAFKPFKVGDFIEAQGYAGTVTEMTIVSTRLTLPDNRSVTIPHGPLANGNINNYSRNPLEKLVEIAKGEELILDSSTPGAADPFATVSSMGDSAVEIMLRAWVRGENYWDAYFAINDKIYKQLPEAGFQFPFPQIDIHVKS